MLACTLAFPVAVGSLPTMSTPQMANGYGLSMLFNSPAGTCMSGPWIWHCLHFLTYAKHESDHSWPIISLFPQFS